MIGKDKSRAREIAKYEQIIHNLKIEIERLKEQLDQLSKDKYQDEHQTEIHLLSQRATQN